MLINWIRNCFLASFALSCSIAVSQQPKASDTGEIFGPQYAASLLQAVMLNNNSILSYDVLFAREVMSVKPGGEVSSIRSRYRLCRDTEINGWFATCVIQTDKWVAGQDPLSSKQLFGLLVTPEGKGFLRDANGILVIPEENIIRAPRYVGWPSFLTLGFERFPDTTHIAGTDSAFWERIIFSQRGLGCSPASRGNVLVTLYVDNDASNDAEYRWVFDPTTMVPSQREVSIRLHDGKTKLRKERGTIDWVERNGIYVPVSIRNSLLKTFNHNGEVLRYEVTDDSELTWKSIGDKLDEKVFTLEHFRDVDPQTVLEIPDADE